MCGNLHTYVVQKRKQHYIFRITAFKICVDLQLKQNQSSACLISYQPFWILSLIFLSLFTSDKEEIWVLSWRCKKVIGTGHSDLAEWFPSHNIVCCTSRNQMKRTFSIYIYLHYELFDEQQKKCSQRKYLLLAWPWTIWKTPQGEKKTAI